MLSGWLFLSIVTLICLGVFFNGLRFARATVNPWAGRRIFGQPVSGADMPLERIRLFGRVQMIAAPLFWLLVLALCLGAFGPVPNILPIQF